MPCAVELAYMLTSRLVTTGRMRRRLLPSMLLPRRLVLLIIRLVYSQDDGMSLLCVEQSSLL